MVPGSAVRAVCALLLCLGCTAAADVDVAGTGPARSLAQAETSSVRPESWWRFPKGRGGAACYVWQETNPRIRTPWRNNKRCRDGLVCCPKQRIVFPKSNDEATAATLRHTKTNRWGTYSLGTCRRFCETPSPSPSPSPSSSPSPAASPSPDASPSPEASPSPDASPSPEASPSPDASPSPEASPSPDASPSPEASPSPDPSPSPSNGN
ncbi:hypothetical protein COO60DRAFT_1703187 [Scenedesmus sp. NREL 46B-D3]|nr:hypothetical protein COO60DRAFT_1703187 [Scenedesmus sp. NREL 46B-D3]